MSKIYTKTGDEGRTSTYAGDRVDKCDCLIEINGAIDTLQAQILRLPKDTNEDMLKVIYKKLMNLATEESYKAIPEIHITDSDVKELEREIDLMIRDLNDFVKFKDTKAIEYNEARVRCRELERKLVAQTKETKVRSVCLQYVNRLSDYFFACAVDHEFTPRCVLCDEEAQDDSNPYVCIHCSRGGRI